MLGRGAMRKVLIKCHLLSIGPERPVEDRPAVTPKPTQRFSGPVDDQRKREGIRSATKWKLCQPSDAPSIIGNLRRGIAHLIFFLGRLEDLAVTVNDVCLPASANENEDYRRRR